MSKLSTLHFTQESRNITRKGQACTITVFGLDSEHHEKLTDAGFASMSAVLRGLVKQNTGVQLSYFHGWYAQDEADTLKAIAYLQGEGANFTEKVRTPKAKAAQVYTLDDLLKSF